MTELNRWTHTIHLSGFLADDGQTWDAHESVSAALCDGSVRNIARGVIKRLEEQGYTVVIGRTWTLDGNIVEIRATVTGHSHGSDIEVGMWHKFLQPGEQWLMAEVTS